MSSKEKLKLVTELYEFIVVTFTEDIDYERILEYYNDRKKFPQDINTFFEHNLKCLKELPIKELQFLKQLKDKIINEDIEQADEEYMGEITTYTFYFNKQKKLVLLSPR